MRALNLQEMEWVSGGNKTSTGLEIPVDGATDIGDTALNAVSNHALDIAAGAAGIAAAAACAPSVVGQVACGTAAMSATYAAPSTLSALGNYLSSGAQAIGSVIQKVLIIGPKGP